MTLLRLMPRASILTGMTFTSLAVYSNPAHAEPEFCIIASNGKTLCRTTRGIERMCITTDGTNTIYGKFKSFKPAGQEAQSENSTPTLIAGYRKESDGVTFLLRSCKRSSSDIKCNLVITTKKEKGLSIATGRGFSSIVDSAGRTYPSSNFEYNPKSLTINTLILSPDLTVL